MAPSSSDSQPWHFVVVREPDTIARLGEIATQGTFLAGAPVVIAICVVGDAPRGHLDAGRAIQQMEIVAWSEGLGTCFVGVRQAEQQVAVKELLGIPEDVELITLLPFGYRQEGFKPQGRSPQGHVHDRPQGALRHALVGRPSRLRRPGRLRQFHIGVSYAPPFRTG